MEVSTRKKEGICYIVGAGSYQEAPVKPQDEDYLIAADAGYLTMKKWNWKPDMIVGDFDSFTEYGGRETEVEKTIRMVRLPVEKDDTDLLAAIKEGMKLGYQNFVLHGATGGRMDHTFANIQCLLYLRKRGCTGTIMDENYEMRVLFNEKIYFEEQKQGLVGIFSLGDVARGVSIQGLKYEVEDAVFTNDFPIGVSNEFVGNKASIEVKDGSLLVIRYTNFLST